MKIGDKVRMLKTTGGGIIRRIIDKNLVEIEIEDGFMIPVLKKEIVIITDDTKMVSGSSDSPNQIEFKRKENLTEGIFLAFSENDEGGYLSWLVNNSPYYILFSIHLKSRDDKFNPLCHGEIGPNNYAAIGAFQLKSLNEWPYYAIELLFFNSESLNKRAPIIDTIQIQAKIFTKPKSKIPVLNRNGIMIPVYEAERSIDPDKIVKSFFDKENGNIHTVADHKPIDSTVDLHIEKLVRDSTTLPISEIIRIQLEYFEKKLNAAIIAGMDQVTFIHGVGNGSLRDLIHKRLGKHPNVKYFEDAQKEKFGYGATKVYIK